MPLGRNALRVVRDKVRLLFWGYVGGRVHGSSEGFIKYDEFVSWLATIYPKSSDYYWEEACTIDYFEQLLAEFVQAKDREFRDLDV